MSEILRTPSEIDDALKDVLKSQRRIQAYSNIVLAEIPKIQCSIDELRIQADELASLFREQYEDARDAYSLEDYEGADYHKQKGYEYETSCRGLNAQIGTLIQKIERYKELHSKSLITLSRYNDKIKSLNASARNIAIPRALKFEDVNISNKDIEKMFLHLPSWHLKNVVKCVTYSNKTRLMNQGRSVASYSVRDKIVLVHKLGAEPDVSTKLNNIRSALIHEVGHGVYHYVLSDEQKAEWHVISETAGPINFRASAWWKYEERRDQENSYLVI